MKSPFAISLLTAASLMAQAGAFAQSRLEATIPFNFTVGEHELPAGTYAIDHIMPRLISVRGWNGNKVVGAVAPIISSEIDSKDSCKLIFNKYGDHYFLSEIHAGEGEVTGKFARSKHEEQVRLQRPVVPEAKTEVALKQE